MTYQMPNETDPISNEQRKWYSSASSPARYEEGMYDYCLYCLNNFKKFYNMVNNICQSCGRVADPVFKNKQENIAVTSINSDITPEQLKAVSLEYDYSPMLSDPTTGFNEADTRMSANSIGEAVKKLRMAEQLNTSLARAAQTNGIKYIQKTNVSKDKEKVLFDGNK